jgi:hypothetical protein
MASSPRWQKPQRDCSFCDVLERILRHGQYSASANAVICAGFADKITTPRDRTCLL